MTVCLAAYSAFKRTIVAVSDMMLSTDWDSTDGVGFKSEPLTVSGEWFALYSGLPEEFTSLSRWIRKELSGRDEISLDTVLGAATNAYSREIVRIGDMRCLAPLGLSREEFFQSREAIGEAAFARVFESLLATALATELMICGFDSDGGHIASVKPDGVYAIHDSIGFHAIGAGAWLALGALYSEPRFVFGQIEKMIYHMCTSKFAAERAPSVGKDTVVMTRDADGEVAVLWNEDVAVVRQEWEAATAPRRTASPKAILTLSERSTFRKRTRSG